MNRILTYMLFLLVAVGALAQVNVSGTVIDKESNEPLAGASVVVKGADGKIKKFATSKVTAASPYLFRRLQDAAWWCR